jgi:metal-responsive CopG/Arc/MetJ family transcriptional regulator
VEADRLKKKRPLLVLPDGLEDQIDTLVGQRGRAAFVREAVRQEIERRRVLASNQDSATKTCNFNEVNGNRSRGPASHRG